MFFDMMFFILCERLQYVNLSEILLESFPGNENLNPEALGVLVPVKHFRVSPMLNLIHTT